MKKEKEAGPNDTLSGAGWMVVGRGSGWGGGGAGGEVGGGG